MTDDILPQHDLDEQKQGRFLYSGLAQKPRDELAYQRRMEGKEREREAYAEGCRAGWSLAWDRAAIALKAYVGR